MVRDILGATHYNAPELREDCEQVGRILMAS